MYSLEERMRAVQLYIQSGCNERTVIRELGYPSHTALRNWYKEYIGKGRFHASSAPKPHYTEQEKEAAVAYFEANKTSLTQTCRALGYPSRYVLRKWILEMAPTLLVKKAKPCISEKTLVRCSQDQKLAAVEAMLVEGQLNNRKKAEVIDAMRPVYRLNDLLKLFRISKSSYFYCIHAASHDKYADLREKIHSTFNSVDGRYGYRRVHASLKRSGIVVSEKVIRRLMKEDGLIVYCAKRKKYSSYSGEISPEVGNIVNRNFQADAPNTKWLTDITEFSLPAGKVYLSPIIDCFDGLAVSWSIGTSPSAELVNTMLDDAVRHLNAGEHPIIHSDRGAHYRWPGWIARMNAAGLIRFMSKKSCSPDNSACEGFFGRLKNEMFYSRSWRDVSLDEFIACLDRYIQWYNNDRIKESLGWMSPVEYRQGLGLAG